MLTIFSLVKNLRKRNRNLNDRLELHIQETERKVYMHVKRTCPLPRCLNSPLDDPNGFNCKRCRTLLLHHYEHMRKQVLEIQNKHDVYQYIRETCNNEQCYSASNRDEEAFTCRRCITLRNADFDGMSYAMEVKEDKAIRKLLSVSLRFPGCPEDWHSLCRPCNCSKQTDRQKPCKCSKSDDLYIDARRKYLINRKAEVEKLNIIAFIRSTCETSACQLASLNKITRFMEATFSSGPPCRRCERFYGNGEADNDQYMGWKKRWEKEVVQMDEVKEFLKGSCSKSAACFFSPGEHDDSEGEVYCQACLDMIHSNYDGKKREMMAAKKLAGEAVVIGLSVERGEGDKFRGQKSAGEGGRRGAVKTRRELVEDLLSGDSSLLPDGYCPIGL